MTQWFTNWFESEWYVRLYRHRNVAEAERAVELVRHSMGLPLGSKVLDLCCGYGRHAYALAETGLVVTGLDASSYLINKAKEELQHDNVEYFVGDMRGPFPGDGYDGIVNFFTSFGYFEEHEENLKVFQSAFNSLRQGGVFMIDFLNSIKVRNTLVPESYTILDGATIVEERQIIEPFVHKKISVNDPCSHQSEFEERVWLYTEPELRQMLETAGLDVVKVYGGYHGEEFTDVSDRCILVSKKPAASNGITS